MAATCGHGRAAALMGALLAALTYMRDTGEIILDIAEIRSFLPLDKIVELALRDDLPELAVGPIRKYLVELPGYTEDEAIMGQIQQKAYEQHRIPHHAILRSDGEFRRYLWTYLLGSTAGRSISKMSFSIAVSFFVCSQPSKWTQMH